MKTRIALLLLFLLLLSGCGADALTPTDAVPSKAAVSSDVVSVQLEASKTAPSVPEPSSKPAPSKVNQPTSKPSSKPVEASAPTSVIEKPSSVPKPVSDTKKPEKPAVAFADWESMNLADYSWEEGISFHTERPSDLGDVVLCNTRADLDRFLQEKSYPMEYADAYPPSYFQTKSLLLFEGCCPHYGRSWHIDGITVDSDTLCVSLLQRNSSRIAAQLVVNRLYRVEIEQKLPDLTKIQCTTRYQDEGKDGAWNTKQTLTAEYPILYPYPTVTYSMP